MTTGLHTGAVPIVVEALAVAPPLEADWEEVVEVSVVANATDYQLSAFDALEPVTLPAPGCYRARFNASGMDLAGEVDVRSSGEPALDSYRLQIWLAPQGPGVILRQTSQMARYWHGVALSEDLA